MVLFKHLNQIIKPSTHIKKINSLKQKNSVYLFANYNSQLNTSLLYLFYVL